MGGLHPRPCWSGASTEPKSKASLPLRRVPPRRRPRGRRTRTHPMALNGTKTRLASVLGSATRLCSALERSRRDHLQNRFSSNGRYALVSRRANPVAVRRRCEGPAWSRRGWPPGPGRRAYMGTGWARAAMRTSLSQSPSRWWSRPAWPITAPSVAAPPSMRAHVEGAATSTVTTSWGDHRTALTLAGARAAVLWEFRVGRGTSVRLPKLALDATWS
jgi:hypothetical protein